MSTISITTPAVVSVRPTTRLRLTTRGRRLLLALAAVPLAAGIGIAAIGGGSAIASGENAGAVNFETVTVMPGDTLWSIAAEIAPAADPRDVISEIENLNLLPGGALQIGQEISIPAQYSE
jgi:hypothetical protein